VPEPVNSDPPQLHYSLIKRAADESILPPLQQHRITALAYSPLEAGVLARLSDSERTQASPRFAKSTTSMIDAALRETVIPIAPRHHATMPPCHHATPAQVSLAWLLQRVEVGAVVVGASTPEQAVSNAAAVDIVLTSSEQRDVGDAFAQVRVVDAGSAGTRARRLLKRIKRKPRKLAPG
jgi:aryl-alcohol dehydrogenase-like predicted oxidoreductase